MEALILRRSLYDIANVRRGWCEETCSEIEKLGVKVLGMKSDVSSPDDVHNLVERTVKEFGRLDIIVNVAEISGEKNRLQD